MDLGVFSYIYKRRKGRGCVIGAGCGIGGRFESIGGTDRVVALEPSALEACNRRQKKGFSKTILLTYST